MANIGLSIESGAMNAVLFDSEEGTVVASQMTSLTGGESTSLPTAVEAMRSIAARRGIDVDTTALVYRSEDERDRFAGVIADSQLGDIELVSASSAFLGWLARSAEFESADCVLLYFLGASGVSVSLADAKSESLTAPKTAVLDSMSPERIGSTVPLAWEVVDAADRKPTAVALFGDRSSSPDVVDILALGLGVPVVRVADADEIAARGAALLAARNSQADKPERATVPAVASEKAVPATAPVTKKVDVAKKSAATKKAVAATSARAAVKIVPTNTAVAKVAATPGVVKETKPVSTKPVPATSASVKPVPAKRVVPAAASVASLAPAAATLPSVRPSAITAAEAAPVALAKRSNFSRKKIVVSAALLAGVLSGGVAWAAVAPTSPPTETGAREVATPEITGIDPSLVGATQSVEITQDPTALAPPEPVVIDPVTQQPVAEAPAQQWTIDPTTGVARPTSEALTPIPASAIPPAAAVVPPKTVEPPVFAVPPIIPEAGKSQEQLEQEAWDRHWAHTAQWLQQEIVGN